MDRRLQGVIINGDVSGLRKLIEENESIIIQHITTGTLNTALHLAARLGHRDLVLEIVKACPRMVGAENAELETPLFEACREGHLEIVQILLEADLSIAYQLNCRAESVLFAASERGRFDVVKHMLNFPMLLMLEADMFTSSLHVATSSGHTGIVKEILKMRPEFATKKDMNGMTPSHIACSKGFLEITRELIKLDSDLLRITDTEGRIPLHCAAIRGRVNIINEILCISRDLAEVITNNGDSILHLAVKSNQFEVIKYLRETINIAMLLNLPDKDGNTVLHLATAGKLTAMVIYLLKAGVDANALNQKGYTALDVIEADATNSGALAIIPALQEAGAKRTVETTQIAKTTSRRSDNEDVLSRYLSWPKKNPENCSPSRRHYRQNRHRAKQIELHNEGLRNARKTITIVAVLIATVTFAAGINPPGGFSQETGKAIRGGHTAFKVFLVCNIVALFLSIGVVNVLVSIIPLRRKTMKKLLTVTHKVMWASTLFMVSAYIAGIWTIMPNGKGNRWILVELVVIGGGCILVVFCGLGMMLARHWYNKYRWRKGKERKINDGSPNTSISRVEELGMIRDGRVYSSNSDVDSSDQGYHLY